MNSQAKAFYELRFKVQFLEAKGAAFQDLFSSIMSKAHPGDFMPCRPWGRIGDRKNDGYLKSERTLFQVYAPGEIQQAQTLRKIEKDFAEALPYWRDYFDVWVFVHNSRDGLPPDVIAKLLALERDNVPIKVLQWGLEELLLRFRLLSPEAAAVPAEGLIDLLSQIANYSSQLGAKEDLTKALEELQELPPVPEALHEKRSQAVARPCESIAARQAPGGSSSGRACENSQNRGSKISSGSEREGSTPPLAPLARLP